jgi:hypothetical protein
VTVPQASANDPMSVRVYSQFCRQESEIFVSSSRHSRTATDIHAISLISFIITITAVILIALSTLLMPK